MSGKNPSKETILRQLEMLRILNPRSKMSTAEIRNALREQGYEVDIRTVQRDLKNFETVFPIIKDDHVPAGWKWSKEARALEIPSMDPLVALTFRMVEDFLGRMLPRNCIAFLDPHFMRAKEVLSTTQVPGLKSWPQRVAVVSKSQPLQPSKIRPEVLEVVYEGVLRNKKIEMKYRLGSSKEVVDRVANPLGLVFKDQVVYLICTLWDYREHKDVLHLALHRMQIAKILDDPTLKVSGFNLQEHVRSGAFDILESDKELKLKIMFYGSTEGHHPADHLGETPLSDDQKITNKDDGKRLVEATVKDTSQLRWWLQGFGSLVEVLAPKALRNEFSETARNLVKRYKVN